MKLNIEELKKTKQDVFDNEFYDTILNAAKELFGSAAVKVNRKLNRIKITSHITLVMSISWNEPKIYFYTFDIPEEIEGDAHYMISKINSCFALYTMTEIIEYLELKSAENDWLKINS